MEQSDWHRINGLLVESATALMEAFGTAVRYDPAGEAKHPPEDGMLAIVGFGGRSMRGNLVVSANRALLDRSFPAPNAGGASAPCRQEAARSTEQLQDWLGELANQLLGRLKSRLLAHGIAIQLGTPTTVSGLDLRVRTGLGDRQATPLWLLSGSDWLVVRLDAIASQAAALRVSADPSNSAAEGDVLLF